jgi:phosphoribosyl-ATP pyrophosphohydrolase/phosphoribosyl-AMP cyclohydrolase
MKFNKDGLVPAVAQDRVTGEVRMVAYATQKAIELTLETGRATFFSRSRNELWEKGRTGANGMNVSGVLVDCDADMAIYLVSPDGPTCHTGAPTCFFRQAVLVDGKLEISDSKVPIPLAIPRLEAVLDERARSTAKESYVKSLYEGGPAKIGEKLSEEAGELSRAVASESKERVVAEAADLLFHVLVALRSRGAAFSDVLGELERRAGTSGHVEKSSREG